MKKYLNLVLEANPDFLKDFIKTLYLSCELGAFDIVSMQRKDTDEAIKYIVKVKNYRTQNVYTEKFYFSDFSIKVLSCGKHIISNLETEKDFNYLTKNYVYDLGHSLLYLDNNHDTKPYSDYFKQYEKIVANAKKDCGREI